MKYISVYVNGVFYEEADDYTFDNRTGVFVFANKFNADEKVTITVSYIDNASGNIDSTYENVYERVKYYDNFSNVTDLNFDIDKFNSFVLDFTKDDSSPITPISIHLPDTDASNGKSIMVTLMFGAQVPVITWSDNIVWEGLTPTFSINNTYIISITKSSYLTKYCAQSNGIIPTKLFKLKKDVVSRDGYFTNNNYYSGYEAWEADWEQPQFSANWWGNFYECSQNIDYDSWTNTHLIGPEKFADAYFDPTELYIKKHGNPNFVSKDRGFVLFGSNITINNTSYQGPYLTCTMDLTKYGLLFPDINLELNSTNVKLTEYDSNLSQSCSVINDNSVDVYEFLDSTVATTLSNYLSQFFSTNENNVPIRVIPK